MPPEKPDWLRDVAAIASDLGRQPTKSEFDEHGSVTAAAFYRYYDSWDDVLDAL